jgi:hypothetical protein
MLFRIILLFLLLLLIDVYAYQALKTLVKIKWLLVSYQVISLFLLVFIVYSFMQFDRSVGQNKQTMITTGLLLLVYVPKLILTIILLGEDVFRLGAGSVNYFTNYNDDASFLASRRKFISQVALGLAAVPFLSLLYGVTKGKYNYQVIRQQVFFPDLPEAFDGFTITQISDVHSGSFDNPDKIN